MGTQEDVPGLPELLFSLASDDRLALLAEADTRKHRPTSRENDQGDCTGMLQASGPSE